MIRRAMKLLVTFHTTTQAMAVESACREEAAPGRLIPVPGSIRAGCGLAWCADVAHREALLDLMARRQLAYEQIHECMI